MTNFFNYLRKIKLFHIEHIFVCLLVLLFGGILAFLSLNLTLFSPFKQAFEDFSITDVYYAIQRTGGETAWSDDIALVDITKQHNRSEIAHTLEEVASCQPRTMLLDIIFSQPSSIIEDDDSLIKVLSAIPNKVFGSKLTDYSEKEKMFKNEEKSFFFDETSDTRGYVNVTKNINNGVLRKYTISQCLNGDTVFSIAWQAANLYSGKKAVCSEPNERLIVYSDTSFPIIPFDSIETFSGLLKDKLVIIGAVKEESDMHITPINKVGGPEVQAYIAQSCLDHPDVTTSSKWFTILLAFLLCYLSVWMGYLLAKKFPLMYLYWLQGYYFVIAALLVWVGFIAFVKYGYFIKMALPFIGVALVEQARLHYKWLISYGNAHPKKKWLHKLTQRSIYTSSKSK